MFCRQYNVVYNQKWENFKKYVWKCKTKIYMYLPYTSYNLYTHIIIWKKHTLLYIKIIRIIRNLSEHLFATTVVKNQDFVSFSYIVRRLTKPSNWERKILSRELKDLMILVLIKFIFNMLYISDFCSVIKSISFYYYYIFLHK